MYTQIREGDHGAMDSEPQVQTLHTGAAQYKVNSQSCTKSQSQTASGTDVQRKTEDFRPSRNVLTLACDTRVHNQPDETLQALDQVSCSEKAYEVTE